MKLIYYVSLHLNQSHTQIGSKTILSKKKIRQQPSRKDLFLLVEKENLTDNRNLSGPLCNDSIYTKNQVFNLHDPLNTVPLSKIE